MSTNKQQQQQQQIVLNKKSSTNNNNNNKSPSSLIFPPLDDNNEQLEEMEGLVKFGTTKRIMKIDPETKLISTEGAIVMGKATELFLYTFALTTQSFVEKNPRVTTGTKGHQPMTYDDVVEAVNNVQELEFLRDLIVELPQTYSINGHEKN
jgi:hypothetical protein